MTTKSSNQKKNATEKEHIRKIQMVNREINQKLSKLNQDQLKLTEFLKHIPICNSDKDPSAIRLLGNASRRGPILSPSERPNTGQNDDEGESPVMLHVVTETIIPQPLDILPVTTIMSYPTHPVTNIIDSSPTSRRQIHRKRLKTPIGTRITRFLDNIESDKNTNCVEVVDACETKSFRMSRTLTQSQWQEKIKQWNPLMAYESGEQDFESDTETNVD